MKLITLPHFVDDAVIVSTQKKTTIPFAIKRVYYLYDIKKGSIRGKHAHKKTKQAIFCIRGSATIVLDDGKKTRTVVLKSPNKGVFIDARVWSETTRFSSGAILLVLASDFFKKSDYIRSYIAFRKLVT